MAPYEVDSLPSTRPPNRLRELVRRNVTRGLLVRVTAGILGALGALLFLLYLGQRGYYNLAFARRILPGLEQGFYLSVEIVVVVITIGFAVGFLVGWARTTRFLLLRGFASIYVDFFRSMPPIVLIVFASIIALLSLRSTFYYDPFLLRDITLSAGVLALALHTAAYQAEIVRAGILSVPAAQTEAADAIGMTRLRSMFRIVLPQAFRVSLPALGNEFSSVIKDTSLLSVIGFYELSGIGLVQASSALRTVSAFAPIIVWLEIAGLYFVITFVVTTSVRVVENLFRVPGLEGARR